MRGVDLVERLRARKPAPDKRPTIGELEAILASAEAGHIEINPDGSISVDSSLINPDGPEAADEIARLREALEPFAKRAANYDPDPDAGDNPDDYADDCEAEEEFTIGLFRRARTALRSPLVEEGEGG